MADVRDHWWWRPGWRVGQRGYAWHLTFGGQRDLHRVVRHWQAALAGLTQVDPVPVDGLHLTLQDVGFVADVPAVGRVAAAVRERLATVPPVELTVERIEVFPESVVLLPEPAGPVAEVRAAVRAGTTDVLGTLPEPPHAFVPHLSVAYVNRPGPAAPLVTAVRTARPAPVTLVVRSVSLVEMHRDAGVYGLDVLDEVRLGGR